MANAKRDLGVNVVHGCFSEGTFTRATERRGSE